MISGGAKFFSRPVSYFSDGEITASASTGTSLVSRALDRNAVTYWRSNGSDDTTTETITITWDASQTFNRIFLVDHNFKEFEIKYLSGVSYVSFASVVGLDGTQSGIAETTFADDTAYYEFTQVSTTSIQVTVLKTQVADEEKYLNQLIVTTELGTLQGYPDITGSEFSRQERSKKMLSGKQLTLKSEGFFKCTLNFKTYPARLSDDIDLMFSLFDKEETFLVWLCGGRRGSNYFKYQLRGFRLRDVFSMQTQGAIGPDYTANVYVSSVNFKVNLIESVD